MSFQIEFKVMSRTEFGESAVICGNLPDLGQWQPEKGHRLTTDEYSYPYWTSSSPLVVNPGTTLEFKLCLIDQAGALVRWEAIEPNRVFNPRSSLLIEFEEAEGPMICQIKRVRIQSELELKMTNIRKGTEQVINDLESDSSSNREMWKEHRFPQQDEGCLLLNEFLSHVNKAISTQREHSLVQVQQPEMQLQKQIKFGNYAVHQVRTHYFVLGSDFGHSFQEYQLLQESVILLSVEEIHQLDLRRKDEVSVFHLIGNQQGWEATLTQFNRWRKKHESQNQHQLKGLFVLYMDPSKPCKLPKQDIDILVCSSSECLSSIVDQFAIEKYSLVSCGKDQFDIFEGHKLKTKLLLYPFQTNTFADHIHQHLQRVLPALKKDFYFPYSQQCLNKQLRMTLKGLRSPRCRLLIVVHVMKLQHLSLKILGDLIQLSYPKHDIIVAIVVQEKLPVNVREKVSITKNNLLVISTEGQIYFNGQETYDLLKYIEISKQKFEENLRLVLQKIDSPMIAKRHFRPHRLVLNLPTKTIGQLLKSWLLRCVRDINKKSLAKISIDVKQNSIQLIPFVLHQNFLLKALLATFGGKLSRHEKGTVISIEGEGVKEVKWLQPPEGAQVNLQFLRVSLCEQHKRNSYGAIPMNHEELRQLLDNIAEQSQLRAKNAENNDDE